MRSARLLLSRAGETWVQQRHVQGDHPDILEGKIPVESPDLVSQLAKYPSFAVDLARELAVGVLDSHGHSAEVHNTALFVDGILDHNLAAGNLVDAGPKVFFRCGAAGALVGVDEANQLVRVRVALALNRDIAAVLGLAVPYLEPHFRRVRRPVEDLGLRVAFLPINPGLLPIRSGLGLGRARLHRRRRGQVRVMIEPGAVENGGLPRGARP
mmetsp:Transcript_67536/g.186402  ORF Transcript_67536/g.186402 Transcript_67536/m.186402 type:complete len:212 (-) Transcript_67536:171-806(-)